jgi:peptidoglycan hydrolase CwlO-like protein
MTKILLILILVFASIAGIFFFLWQLSKSNHKRTQDELARTKAQLKTATDQIKKIESTLEIINHNRKESDEKIDALNTGDVIDNALNELCNN